MRIQSKVSNLFFSKGEVLVEIPDSSRNCGCPQHECRMCYEMMRKKAQKHTHGRRMLILELFYIKDLHKKAI